MRVDDGTVSKTQREQAAPSGVALVRCGNVYFCKSGLIVFPGEQKVILFVVFNTVFTSAVPHIVSVLDTKTC